MDADQKPDADSKRQRQMRRRDVLSWVGIVIAVAALSVVAWVLITSFDGVAHSHPAYAVLLGVTVVGALGFGVMAVWRPVRRGAWRVAGRIVLLVLAIAWVAAIAWLRPYTAVEPALAAMESSDTVTVTETSSRIVFEPSEESSSTGVLFQPGALVDPRAYAAVLRPLAEAGHTVVIVKQPLGIAFFALADADAVAEEQPSVASWVIGGHSLGGTVASMQVSDDSAGLLLYASYPADDISDLTAPVLSISGSRDGLATPEKIEASQPDLPEYTTFLVVDGGSHAYFGDYGVQAGDGEPTIDHDDARTQISDASVAFVNSLG